MVPVSIFFSFASFVADSSGHQVQGKTSLKALGLKVQKRWMNLTILSQCCEKVSLFQSLFFPVKTFSQKSLGVAGIFASVSPKWWHFPENSPAMKSSEERFPWPFPTSGIPFFFIDHSPMIDKRLNHFNSTENVCILFTIKYARAILSVRNLMILLSTISYFSPNQHSTILQHRGSIPIQIGAKIPKTVQIFPLTISSVCNWTWYYCRSCTGLMSKD